MTALDELTKDTNWDYEEQCMDGAPLGYAEVYYIGDPVFAQAKLELAALREAGEKMAKLLKLLQLQNEAAHLESAGLWSVNGETETQVSAALAEWEAANK